MNPDDFTFTLPFGIGGLFDPLFEDAGDLAMQVFDTLAVFAYILAFAGLLITVYKMMLGGDLSGLGNQLMMTVIVAVSLHFVVDWVLDAQQALGFTLMEEMDADPGGVTDDYIQRVAVFVSMEVANIVAQTFLAFLLLGATLGNLIWAVIVVVVVVIFAAAVWVAVVGAYIFQSLAIVIGISIIPIFLGMLLFPNTKETGIKYFWGLVGVMFWPLGWGIGFRLIGVTAELWEEILLMLAPLTALDIFFGGIVTGTSFVVEAILYWTVLTKAPKLIEAAITTGSQLGAGMISAMSGGVMGAAGTAASVAGAAAGAVASGASGAASGGMLGGGGGGGGAIGGGSKGGGGGGMPIPGGGAWQSASPTSGKVSIGRRGSVLEDEGGGGSVPRRPPGALKGGGGAPGDSSFMAPANNSFQAAPAEGSNKKKRPVTFVGGDDSNDGGQADNSTGRPNSKGHRVRFADDVDSK
jgi:hypothetical protein